MDKLSKEQLMMALMKKRQCNAYALRVVESFLEPVVDPEEFLEKLPDINQCHYDDVVEERHLLNLCSYPLCSHIIDKVPRKTYQISTITNKVYDITERKKFCSSECFRASEYIKSQLLTSPLWLRHLELRPELKLLSSEHHHPCKYK